jgi:hypothetical protein
MVLFLKYFALASYINFFQKLYFTKIKQLKLVRGFLRINFLFTTSQIYVRSTKP